MESVLFVQKRGQRILNQHILNMKKPTMRFKVLN